MGSAHFRNYVSMINRIHLVELIEVHTAQRTQPKFRASLVVNPLTGVPYPCQQHARATSAVA